MAADQCTDAYLSLQTLFMSRISDKNRASLTFDCEDRFEGKTDDEKGSNFFDGRAFFEDSVLYDFAAPTNEEILIYNLRIRRTKNPSSLIFWIGESKSRTYRGRLGAGQRGETKRPVDNQLTTGLFAGRQPLFVPGC